MMPHSEIPSHRNPSPDKSGMHEHITSAENTAYDSDYTARQRLQHEEDLSTCDTPPDEALCQAIEAKVHHPVRRPEHEASKAE